MTCPTCGAEIGTDSAGCPLCLIGLGLAGDAETATSPAAAASARSAGARLEPGQRFGPYRIERLLGRGGMGEVYEAEHLDDGRRVALKTLRQALADERDRARFIREGQLAASVSHPNTVYIFGAEEIAGTPIITMELVAGGTLKDRVSRDGPMPPAAAVDAILQVISGLDAAHVVGILHRDIKPSNCFINHDGTVKVGDFGLSISTMARGVSSLTTSGSFQGTPQFASPEQLKGAPLDVRSDIYAVGATMYYLLTGRAPFEADDLVALLTRVATEPPASPRERQRHVPKALAAVVLTCLAKDPAARPAGYAALAERLRPFGSAALVGAPPPIGLRFVAGLVDYLGFVLMLIVVAGLATLAIRLLALPAPPEPSFSLSWIVWPAFAVYLALFEAYGGGAIGKRVLGLRVVSQDGSGRPPISRAVVRAVVFVAFLAGANGAMEPWRRAMDASIEFEFLADLLGRVGGMAVFLGLLGLLFATARRRNGSAGLHELLSRTRVVQRVATADRDAVDSEMAVRADAWVPTDERIGPYRVVAEAPVAPPEGLIAGFDEALRRPVWIERVSPDAPPIPTSRRDLSRQTRLRWLGGSRSADAWDAWEVSAGVPLTAWFRKPLAWRGVRTALTRLTEEVRAGLAEGALPALRLDRIWIAPGGALQLLEWPARHGSDRASSGASKTAVDLAEIAGFLHAVAAAALGTAAASQPSSSVTPEGVRVPLSARRLLNDLRKARIASLDEVTQRLAALEAQPLAISISRRALHLVITGLFPAQMLLFSFVVAGALPADTMLGRASESLRFQLVTGTSGFFLVMLMSLPLAVFSRGGLILRLLGIGLVDRDGREISPHRAGVRALVAWSPILVVQVLLWFGPMVPGPAGGLPDVPGWLVALTVGLMTVFLAGVLWAAVRPQRGIQDHIAGTWLVPR